MRLPHLLLILCLPLAAVGCSETTSAPDSGQSPDLTSPDIRSESPDRGAPDTTGGACDPLTPRASDPELMIGPQGVEQKLLAKIDGAQSELLVMMYQLTLSKFINALIETHEKGVTVRIILDGDQQANENALAQLEAAGVAVHKAPTRFNHYHAKVFLIDGEEALVMSGNLNSYTMNSERNYGVFLRDAQDIAQIREIFEQDWSDAPDPTLPCTRLLVSPINAAERLPQFVESAAQTLDLAVMYISDSGLREAVKARARAGVSVRVLLAHPSWIDNNAETAAELAAEGIPVKYLTTQELHAKLIVADDVPYVGSINLSYNSLNNNREVGVLVTHSPTAQAVAAQFSEDWLAGVAP